MRLTGGGRKRPVTIQAYEYQSGPEIELPFWQAWGEMDDLEAEASPEEVKAKAKTAASSEQLSAEFQMRLQEETRRSYEAGRAQGIQEGRMVEREAHSSAIAATEQQRLHHMAQLTEQFSQARERYLHSVEHEVVKLSMAVAARILRREAQMDPLLLLGAVRVALGQLSASTKVRLRVPQGELQLWTEAMALLPKLSSRPEVVPGENMRLGDCVIETEMGSVDLGVRAQLNEIERGFFDRAGASSGAPPQSVMETESHG